MINVPERILKLKNERGWSIYKLAENANLPQSTVANMFPRKTTPSIYTLNRICEAFGITLSEFFDEKAENPEEIRLIYLFRQLTNIDKKTLTAIADILRKKDK